MCTDRSFYLIYSVQTKAQRCLKVIPSFTVLVTVSPASILIYSTLVTRGGLMRFYFQRTIPRIGTYFIVTIISAHSSLWLWEIRSSRLPLFVEPS